MNCPLGLVGVLDEQGECLLDGRGVGSCRYYSANLGRCVYAERKAAEREAQEREHLSAGGKR